MICSSVNLPRFLVRPYRTPETNPPSEKASVVPLRKTSAAVQDASRVFLQNEIL
jgi:hypothetical protein